MLATRQDALMQHETKLKTEFLQPLAVSLLAHISPKNVETRTTANQSVGSLDVAVEYSGLARDI